MTLRATAVLTIILLACVPEGAAREPDWPCGGGGGGCGGATCGRCGGGNVCYRCSVNDGGGCGGGATANHYCAAKTPSPACTSSQYLSWKTTKCLDEITCGKGERFVPQS